MLADLVLDSRCFLGDALQLLIDLDEGLVLDSLSDAIFAVV